MAVAELKADAPGIANPMTCEEYIAETTASPTVDGLIVSINAVFEE